VQDQNDRYPQALPDLGPISQRGREEKHEKFLTDEISQVAICEPREVVEISETTDSPSAPRDRRPGIW
jgi:hypothetical protein